MPLPRATSFKGVLSLAPWAMANFAPVSFWLLASTLRNAISPVQTLTSLPGWLLWSCHALGLWEYSKSMELTLQGLPMTALPLSLAL